MRGEHVTATRLLMLGVGSSPHARGALSMPILKSPMARIIPACAGSTVACGEYRLLAVDHPRMRGEHNRAYVIKNFGPWIIPACAGSIGDR